MSISCIAFLEHRGLLQLYPAGRSDYHGGKGPAYLVGAVYNARLGARIFQAHFTTGTYLVQDFSCRMSPSRAGAAGEGPVVRNASPRRNLRLQPDRVACPSLQTLVWTVCRT